MPKLIKAAIIISGASIVIGCASNNVVHMDTSGPKMVELLEGVDAETTAEIIADNEAIAKRNKLAGFQDYEAFTRDTVNEINQLFPMHDNPQIALYIHPHLATDGNYPIPGYTTAFTLYEKNEYALPSEIAPHYLTD